MLTFIVSVVYWYLVCLWYADIYCVCCVLAFVIFVVHYMWIFIVFVVCWPFCSACGMVMLMMSTLCWHSQNVNTFYDDAISVCVLWQVLCVWNVDIIWNADISDSRIISYVIGMCDVPTANLYCVCGMWYVGMNSDRGCLRSYRVYRYTTCVARGVRVASPTMHAHVHARTHAYAYS